MSNSDQSQLERELQLHQRDLEQIKAKMEEIHKKSQITDKDLNYLNYLQARENILKTNIEIVKVTDNLKQNKFDIDELDKIDEKTETQKNRIARLVAENKDLLKEKMRLQEIQNDLPVPGSQNNSQTDLLFDENAAKDKFLDNSKNIAQRMIQTKRFRSIFKYCYYSEEAKTNIKNVKIEFGSQPIAKDKVSCEVDWLAWTYRNKDANNIFINEIFKQRLLLISENNEENNAEKEIIILMMAFLIIHELAHLLTRWMGDLFSPELFGTYSVKPEAGYYMEKQLFHSVINIVIPKNVQDIKQWTAETPITSISIRKALDKQNTKVLTDVKLDKSYIHQVVTNYVLLSDEEILALNFTGSNQIDLSTEVALNAGDSDFEEVDYDANCPNEFDENECIFNARCGSILK